MKVVRNSIVSMDWDADGFIESKRLGFISAVHCYGDVPVAFRDGRVYTCVDGSGSVISFGDMVKEIKNAVKSKDSDYPYYYEDYAEIYDGMEYDYDVLEFLGIRDYVDDISLRLKDLGEYWSVVESETL